MYDPVQRERSGGPARVDVLIVGGLESIRQMLVDSTGRRFDVEGADTTLQAGKSFRALRPQVVLIDAMLPGDAGIQLCRYIRQQDSEVVLLLVSPEVHERYKVRGFEAGTDDYLTWPFGQRELVCRIEAKLWRSPWINKLEKIEAGSLKIDLRKFRAHVDGRIIPLRPKEFALLASLASSNGGIKLRQELVSEIWGKEAVDRRTLCSHISRVRSALRRHSDHEYIECVRGLGYRFRPDTLYRSSIEVADPRRLQA